jgi:hypothetical protein
MVYCNMESHSSTINNTLKSKHQENHEKILKEKESLFDNFKQREQVSDCYFLLSLLDVFCCGLGTS